MTTPSVEILDKAVEDLRALVAQINGKYDEVTKLLLDYSDNLVKTNFDKFDTLLITETKIFRNLCEITNENTVEKYENTIENLRKNTSEFKESIRCVVSNRINHIVQWKKQLEQALILTYNSEREPASESIFDVPKIEIENASYKSMNYRDAVTRHSDQSIITLNTNGFEINIPNIEILPATQIRISYNEQCTTTVYAHPINIADDIGIGYRKRIEDIARKYSNRLLYDTKTELFAINIMGLFLFGRVANYISRNDRVNNRFVITCANTTNEYGESNDDVVGENACKTPYCQFWHTPFRRSRVNQAKEFTSGEKYRNFYADCMRHDRFNRFATEYDYGNSADVYNYGEKTRNHSFGSADTFDIDKQNVTEIEFDKLRMELMHFLLIARSIQDGNDAKKEIGAKTDLFDM